MSEETKEKKQDKSCCSHDGKCCCGYKKYFPHNWFKLKCLTYVFNTVFYLGLLATIFMIVQLVRIIPLVRSGMVDSADFLQMCSTVVLMIVFTFFMLAVAKICKALRKIKCLLKDECKDKQAK